MVAKSKVLLILSLKSLDVKRKNRLRHQYLLRSHRNLIGSGALTAHDVSKTVVNRFLIRQRARSDPYAAVRFGAVPARQELSPEVKGMRSEFLLCLRTGTGVGSPM